VSDNGISSGVAPGNGKTELVGPLYIEHYRLIVALLTRAPTKSVFCYRAFCTDFVARTISSRKSQETRRTWELTRTVFVLLRTVDWNGLFCYRTLITFL